MAKCPVLNVSICNSVNWTNQAEPTPRPVLSSEFVLAADQIVKAIGQTKPSVAELLHLETEKGKIRVNEFFETSVSGIYAGGDCIRVRGAASTVMGAQDGKLAAQAIHDRLTNHGAANG